MTDAGHRLAAAQLAALEASSGGAVQMLAELDDDEFLISLDTHGVPRGPGVPVRGREQFRISIPATYPFEHPSVRVNHRRWSGSPHVQWGDLLCLYAAPSVEWNPAEGMRGFLERLALWIERAAAGDLDPDGQPLHPPVAYPRAGAGQMVVHPDLGDRVPWAGQGDPAPAATLFAWCIRDRTRIEVREWLTMPQVADRVLTKDHPQRVDERGRVGFLVSVVLLSSELGFEYPDTARALARAMTAAGFSSDQLLLSLARTAVCNQLLLSPATASEETRDPAETENDGVAGPPPLRPPVVIIVGTPSRRVNGSTRLAHLVAWQLDDLGSRVTALVRDEDDVFFRESLDSEVGDLGRQWLSVAKVAWMRVHELRPEITQRRDGNTPATWLHGKRVLVLGCGALGAPIAEYCVRAGVKRLTVLDSGIVTPGILVRQPYSYHDVGHAKVLALTDRLNDLVTAPVVTAQAADAATTLLDPRFDPTAFDLIVDATADAGARAALERSRSARRADWPPVATTVIGHEAERGVVCLSRRGATGAGHDVLRRLALRVHGAENAPWADVAADLFPDPPRTATFFPEPGCSAPTFVGSAAQVAALAAQQLLRVLNLLVDDTDSPMVATAIRVAPSTPIDPGVAAGSGTVNGSGPRDVPATTAMSWSNDVVRTDETNGFEVRISASALAEVRAETRRVHRLHGPRVETGGMLLGAVDEALRVIHVDVATGPPPDSRLSAVHFEHGLEGTQAAVDHHGRRTGRRTGYVGLWHTHPHGPARPSDTDTDSLATLTDGPGAGRWALMLIFGGSGPTWSDWRDSSAPPQVYVATVYRDTRGTGDTARSEAAAAGQAAARRSAPAGRYFPGGYARPESVTSTRATRSRARRALGLMRLPWRRVVER